MIESLKGLYINKVLDITLTYVIVNQSFFDLAFRNNKHKIKYNINVTYLDPNQRY
jgi:hypothetical protein